MSTNVTSSVGASPQILRGTPVAGEDIQHVVVADPTGTLPAAVTGTISSNGGALASDVATMGAVAFQVVGTWVGTLQLEGRAHPSAALTPLKVRDVAGNEATSIAANGTYFANVAGLERVRVAAIAWTSGTATVHLRAEQGAPPPMAASGIESVHHVRPAGSVQKVVMVEGEAGIAADTLVTTAIVNTAGTVTTGQTSVPVTALKTFRVVAIQYTVYATNATTPPWLRIRLRFNPTGTAVIGSPQYLSLVAGPSAAFVNSSTAIDIDTPNGIVDLPAGATNGGFAISKSGSATTPTNGSFNLTLSGYEF